MSRIIERVGLLTVALLGLTITLALAAPVMAQGELGKNMIGQQSHNEGIHVLPAPDTVTIDGRIDEWDWSGRIWVFADENVRDRYSVQAAAMWDKDYLYLASRWNDPTPMRSPINPEFNPELGWCHDAWQMRVLTDEPIWLTTWYYTEKQQPVMHVEYSRNGRHPGGGEIKLLTASPGGTQLGHGVRMAYRETDDGKGFVQEMRIPWDLLYAEEAPTREPGATLQIGMEFLWGGPGDGRSVSHRYADNMQPGVTSREFFWKNTDAWGDATLRAEGNVEPRQYQAAESQLPGTIMVRATVPTDATRFTIVIEDERGNRVRNLVADRDPRAHTVELRGDERVVEVPWDGKNDAGRMVSPGNYMVRGLTHDGLGATFETTFYNPGHPPWMTGDGTGSWGSNHASPYVVAAGGERMFIGWPGSEGGSALIGMGADGEKIWGELRGAIALAADNDHVYAAAPRGGLLRYAAETGDYRPFEKDGSARAFDLSLSTIFKDELPGHVRGLARLADGLVMTLQPTPKRGWGRRGAPDDVASWTGRIALLDARSAEVKQVHTLDKAPGAVAVGADGAVYVLLDGALHEVNLNDGSAKRIDTPALEQAGDITVDGDGHIVIYDAGDDSQLKAYSPQGELVYTSGQRGGRPLHGKWQAQGMMRVSSVAADHAGHLWTAENWKNPRRVSVWAPGESVNEPGKLVRDYIGCTGYAGTNSYMHDSNPNLAYVGSVEMKLDKANHQYEVRRILWVPDERKNQAFSLWTHPHWFSNPAFFTSDASGEKRRYLYFNGQRHRFQALYMERDGSFVPVSAITNTSYIGRALPEYDLGEHAENAGVFWHDRDGDAALDRNELTILDRAIGQGVYWASWNIDHRDLSIYMTQHRAHELMRYKPTGFTDAGAPVYGPKGMQPLNDVKATGRNDIIPLKEENRIITMGRNDVSSARLDTQQQQWRYPNPYHSVHGSHKAPIAQPGLLIGSLKFLGHVKVNERVGRVFAIRGNLGQDYYITSDGLYVGAMFNDGRLPGGKKWPDTQEALTKVDMTTFTNGGEPFNGWMGRHSDGEVRVITPMVRRAGTIVRLSGLTSIRRFNAGSMQLDAETLMKANEANIARAAEQKEDEKRYTVQRIDNQKKIDAKRGDWRGTDAVRAKRRGQRMGAQVHLAYDQTNLYALFRVWDDSPWMNNGKDFRRLFKTGDAVDLQLGPAPDGENVRSKPTAGDTRVVIAPHADGATAVVMQPVAKNASSEAAHTYSSPVHDKAFDRVARIDGAKIAQSSAGRGYVVEVAIPWRALNMSAPASGTTMIGDLGVIGSDAQGQVNTSRTYWANPHTNLVNDEPAEAWLYPARWGELRFE